MKGEGILICPGISSEFWQQFSQLLGGSSADSKYTTNTVIVPYLAAKPLRYFQLPLTLNRSGRFQIPNILCCAVLLTGMVLINIVGYNFDLSLKVNDVD